MKFNTLCDVQNLFVIAKLKLKVKITQAYQWQTNSITFQIDLFNHVLRIQKHTATVKRSNYFHQFLQLILTDFQTLTKLHDIRKASHVETLRDFPDSSSTADTRLVVLVAAVLWLARLRHQSSLFSARPTRQFLIVAVFIVLWAFEAACGGCSVV